MAEQYHAGAFCPKFHHAVELVGRRWTGAILRALLSDVTRFSDLTAAIPGLSDRMLSERLKELEAEGLVLRHVFPETPVRIAYELTEKGRSLGDVIEAVSVWAERWSEPASCGVLSVEEAVGPPLPAPPAGRGRHAARFLP